MPLTNVGSRWSAGDLIFYEKKVSEATIANILTIGDDAVTVGSATNDVDFKYLASGSITATIDCGAATFTLTGIATTLGALTIREDEKLYIRDTGIYLQSPADGRLTIAADGTGQTYGVMFMMGAGKSIYISSAIELADQGATNYSNEGALWFSSVTKKLEWYNSTEIRYLIDSDTAGAVTLTSDLTISGTDKRVYFRNANIWIGSISTTQLQITSPGTTENAIYLTTGTGGGVLFGSYIGAFKTDTNGTEEGQIWYDESENRVKVNCGPDGVKTLAVVA